MTTQKSARAPDSRTRKAPVDSGFVYSAPITSPQFSAYGSAGNVSALSSFSALGGSGGAGTVGATANRPASPTAAQTNNETEEILMETRETVGGAAAPLVYRNDKPQDQGAEAAFQKCVERARLLYRVKKIDLSTLACTISMPIDNVRQALDGVDDALRKTEWEKVIAITGLDVKTARLSRGTPHFIFHDATTKKLIETLSPLFENTKAARLDFKERKSLFGAKTDRILMLQNDHLRVVVIEAPKQSFMAVAKTPKWFLESEKRSVVKTTYSKARFVSCDMSAIDFDSVFNPAGALDWGHVDTVARANRVSIEEIVAFIKAEGDRKEQMGDPYLRAVEPRAPSVAHVVNQ